MAHPKKRIAAVALLGVLCLAGCGHPAAQPASSAALPPAADQTPKETTYGTLEKCDVGSMAITSQGMYLCEQYGSGFMNLMYVDFATMKKIFLCANPSCRHNNDSCTSYIPFTGEHTYPGIMALHDQLYLVQTSAAEGALPTVTKVSADGTERKKLFEMSAAQDISGGFLADDKYLYFFMNEVAGDTATRTVKLMRADQESGNCEELYLFGKENLKLPEQGGEITVALSAAVGTQIAVTRYPSGGEKEEYKTYLITPTGDITKELQAEPVCVSDNKDRLAQIYPGGILSTSWMNQGTASIAVKDLIGGSENTLTLDAKTLGLGGTLNSAFMGCLQKGYTYLRPMMKTESMNMRWICKKISLRRLLYKKHPLMPKVRST